MGDESFNRLFVVREKATVSKVFVDDEIWGKINANLPNNYQIPNHHSIGILVDIDMDTKEEAFIN